MEKMYEYLINKIFTVPYFDKMISGESTPDAFLKCVKRYVKEDDITYGKAISEIYHYMQVAYRNEYFYKNTIFNQLLIKKHNLYKTAALTELPIAESKADFIMINGKGVVYEIKTDLDNLVRLENQINDYYKAFSYVYVVVGVKQYKKVREFLEQKKVGIYVLYDSGNLICRKKAVCDNEELSYETMFRMLRKKEFERILFKYYKKLPQVNSFQYYRECLEWIKKIDILLLQKELCTALKARTLLVINNPLEENIPQELRFYAYFSKEFHGNYEKIDTFLNSKMEV